MLMIQRVPESPIKKQHPWEFPADPVVSSRCLYCQGLGSLLGQQTKILKTTGHGQKKF